MAQELQAGVARFKIDEEEHTEPLHLRRKSEWAKPGSQKKLPNLKSA